MPVMGGSPVTVMGVSPMMKAATTPDTVTFRSAASTSSSTAVIVTVSLLVNSPAAMISTLFVLSSKSAAVAGATGTADTLMAVGVSAALSSAAVTVAMLPDPLSSMRAGVSFRTATGFASVVPAAGVVHAPSPSAFTARTRTW